MKTWSRVGTLVVLAFVTGGVAGITAWLFHVIISIATITLFTTSDPIDFLVALKTLPAWYRVMLPTLGGLCVGLLFYTKRFQAAAGDGVPEAMKAELFNASKITPMVVPLKLLAASLTLSTGGSAGREGPIVHIGSAIGSAIAMLTKRREADRRLLLAAGAAAGIAGMFAAPLSGIVFSIELILKRVSVQALYVLGIAAFAAFGITKYGLGFNGFSLVLPQPLEPTLTVLILTVPLGVCAGIIALWFGAFLRHMPQLMALLPLPTFLYPAVGGFVVGLFGLIVPNIHEPATYATFSYLFEPTTPLIVLLTLLVIKLLATCVTLGSGGVGGIFAPSLLIGALLGALFGGSMVMLGFVSPSTSVMFVIVGMAAVFAAVTHAPLTAMVVVFEVTGEFLSVPLTIIATMVAYLLAKTLHSYSAYTEHVSRTTTQSGL